MVTLVNFMTNRTLHALSFQVRDVGALLAITSILKMDVRRIITVLNASVIRIIATTKTRSHSRPLSNATSVSSATIQPIRSVPEKSASKLHVVRLRVV